MRFKSSEKLYQNLKEGVVYRREELAAFSTSVDRDLKSLLSKKIVKKAGAGLYYRPKMSRFGPLPTKPNEVVRAFLKSDDFLITSLDVFNGMEVGLTQLTNEALVYNRKRVGRFILDGQRYYFKRPPNFPRKVDVRETFLFVDLLNNYDDLLEPPDRIWISLKRKIKEYSYEELTRLAKEYGKVSTQRMLRELVAND